MESEKLYSHYTNKKPDANGALARAEQRLRWLRSYKKNGKCQRKLQQAGVL
jgi:NADH pyrophosphatase NudC (nudix superfamily)